jgi:hypothetical protein
MGAQVTLGVLSRSLSLEAFFTTSLVSKVFRRHEVFRIDQHCKNYILCLR